jgi:hypothetical protein
MPTLTLKLVYLVAAIGGGGLLLVQMVLSLFGADHDADVDGDLGDHGDGGTLFSLRAVIAFFTFFGIGGMAALEAGAGSAAALLTAIGSGLVAFLLVGVVLLQFRKLRSSGTVDIRNAVGTEGKVYLTVPAAGAGEGAVTVQVQGRTLQFKAVTQGSELKTGALCRIRAVRSNDTLEIEPS